MVAPAYYPGAIYLKSPYQNDGPSNGRSWPENVTYAVQHHTDGSAQSVINTFTSPTSSRHVSAHLMITRDAKVYQFVRFDNIAWHAGNWDANVRSVGLEHVQYKTTDPELDDGTGWTKFTEAQLRKSAEVQNWLKHYMPRYDMEPHDHFAATSCPGDLPVETIQQYMEEATMPGGQEWQDEATGIKIIGGMYARWKQLYAMLGNEIYMVVGHPTHAEEEQADGTKTQKFEHEIWRWKSGQAPSRFDILADILYPPD